MRHLLIVCLLLCGAARTAFAAIVIDGIVSEPEWTTATSAVNTVNSNWTTANRLDRIRAFTDADYLYIAIDGAISGNSIILYVDSKLGGYSNLAASLTDNFGEVDNALTSALVAGAEFTADFGWGTLDMNRSSAASDDRLGWRGLTNSSDFIWLYGTAFPSACSAGACETKIPLATLDGTGVIKLFARLCNPSGNFFANQNLPMDNPTNPQAVNVWMSVPRSTSPPVPAVPASGLVVLGVLLAVAGAVQVSRRVEGKA